MFGMGGKGEKAPTAGQAIQKLRETEDMLVKKQEILVKKIAQETEIARKNGTKNKIGKFIEDVSCLFLMKGFRAL